MKRQPSWASITFLAKLWTSCSISTIITHVCAIIAWMLAKSISLRACSFVLCSSWRSTTRASGARFSCLSSKPQLRPTCSVGCFGFLVHRDVVWGSCEACGLTFPMTIHLQIHWCINPIPAFPPGSLQLPLLLEPTDHSTYWSASWISLLHCIYAFGCRRHALSI